MLASTERPLRAWLIVPGGPKSGNGDRRPPSPEAFDSEPYLSTSTDQDGEVTRSEPTTQEQFAAEVVRRVTGLGVTYADVDTCGAIDWWLEDRGVRVGGMEVTMIIDQAMAQAMKAAGKTYWPMPEARWAWVLEYDAHTDFRQVRRHLGDLVTISEKHRVVSPDLLPDPLAAAYPSVKWYEQNTATLTAYPAARRSGVVDVLPRGGGGAAGNIDATLNWIDGRLAGPMSQKVNRLEEVKGRRHLFLAVHDSGIPFEHFYPLCADHQVPTRPPRCDLLDELWMLPGWGQRVLRWSKATGWGWYDYSRLEGKSSS